MIEKRKASKPTKVPIPARKKPFLFGKTPSATSCRYEPDRIKVVRFFLGRKRIRTLNRHRFVGREYVGVEIMLVKELGQANARR